MKILAFNTFGSPRAAHKKIRLWLLAQEIIAREIDVALLSEVVFAKDVRVLEGILKPAGYTFYYDRPRLMIPGGLVTVSRVPVNSYEFIEFKHQGGLLAMISGDKLLGKGFQVLRLELLGKPVCVMSTHLVADYWSIAKDKFNKHIDLQLRQIMHWVIRHSAQGNLIISGDFNFGPRSPHHKTMQHTLGVVDGFSDEHEPTTMDLENMYNMRRRVLKINARLDHIFHRFSHEREVRLRRVFKNQINYRGRGYHLSDHYGILMELE